MKKRNIATRQVAVLTAGLLAVVMSLSACSSPSGDEAVGQVASDKTITLASSDPENLTPGNSYAFQLNSLLFSTLLKVNPETGTTDNLLADSVTSSDQINWDIKLKPGWKFHNGEPVTAQSFVDAWNATAYGPNAWVQNSYFSQIDGYAALNPADGSKPATDKLSGLKVVSDTELKVKLSKPNGLFTYTLANFALAPMPKAAFEDPKAFNVNPIGNGPYKMRKQYTANETVQLERNDDYTGPAAKTKYLDFKPYTNYSTAYNDVLAGSIDMVYPVAPDRLSDVPRSFKDSNIQSPIPNLNYLAFPMWEKKFENADLRKAISMAIDRETITKTILQGSADPAYGMAPAAAEGSRANTCESCQYDPTKAKELFEKAGGWNGPMTLWASSYDKNDQILQAIANQLRNNLGIEDIKFELSSKEYELVKAKKTNGPMLEYWGAYFPHIQAMVEPFYAKNGAGNITGYNNPKVDALLAEGDKTTGAAAIASYQQAEDLALQDMYVVPLYFGKFTAVWGKNVESVPVGPQGLGDLTQMQAK